MLVGERRDLLLARLAAEGKVLAKDVAAELGVSEDSIRRDLRDLAAAGLCQRVYGGALPVSPAVADYASRTAIAVDGKDRVAKAAAGLGQLRTEILVRQHVDPVLQRARQG